MSEIDVAQFLGCSPTLNTAVGSTGKAGQNYKYYLIPGGPKPGSVWITQNTRQKEPDESLLNHTWTYYSIVFTPMTTFQSRSIRFVIRLQISHVMLDFLNYEKKIR
ncbi:hypothetical protein K435DRAFT_873999 [Dendrothele bispora CBS 962.96]|uniref:Uncharacterized protein n=1 Tax=Dendrothele bispora (strain CBS 962.96) TaxID=1314807 RepID=A0A4S8KXR3_DENBC|nr:hypothetical protein K435DRAFT_873999 [Dendrothele bispora CBS 962.96]